MRITDLYFDKLYNGIVTGSTALARNGLTTTDYTYLNLITPYKEVNGIRLVGHAYYYVRDIDNKNFLYSSSENSNLLIPTAERALVENIKYEWLRDEGVLIEALNTYLMRESDLTLLYEVADFYSLEREELEYWLEESKEWTGA